MSITISDVQNDTGSLQFVLAGSYEDGLDKSVPNAIRRTLLNDIPTVAFETDEDADTKDLTMVTNHSSLHNEMLLHRVALVPLYLDPEEFKKHYLFECHVKHDKPEPFRFITANDMNIYPLHKHLQDRIDELNEEGIQSEPTEERDLMEILETHSPDNYQMDKPLTQKDKDKILRPFEFRGNKNYCLINELKHTGTEGVHQEVHYFGSPSVKTGALNSRYQAVSQASYSFVKDDTLIQETLENKLKLQDISEEDKESFTKKFMLGESERYFKRDKYNEPNEYLFKIKSTHYWSSEELFRKALDILMDACETLKAGYLLLLQEKTSSVTVNQVNDYSYIFTMNQQSHTLGSMLQSHLSRKCIEKEGLILSAGYKKPHPLEESIHLYVSLNPNHKLSKDTELHKLQGLVTFLMDQLDILRDMCKDIHELSGKAF